VQSLKKNKNNLPFHKEKIDKYLSAKFEKE